MTILGLLMVIVSATIGKSERTTCSRKDLTNGTLSSMLEADTCKSLDIEHAVLRPDQDEVLRTSIGYAGGLDGIKLHNVKGLSDDTCAAFANAMRSMPGLHELELSGMVLSQQCIRSFAAGLQTAPFTGFRSLRLSGSTLHLQPILNAMTALEHLENVDLQRAVVLDEPAPIWIIRKPLRRPDGTMLQFTITTKNTMFASQQQEVEDATGWDEVTATQSDSAPYVPSRSMSGVGSLTQQEADAMDARIKEKEAKIQQLVKMKLLQASRQ